MRRSPRTPRTPRRDWTILLVPPEPSAQPRALQVRAWQVRAAATAVMLTLAGMSTWVATDRAQGTMTAAQLARSQLAVAALADSLRAVREATAATAARDSAARTAAASVVAPQGRPRLRATSPFAARLRARGAGGLRPMAGVVLPVIGRITSGFARSRLHPLLGIFRPHHGVDVSAPRGTSITAPAAGRVAFVGRRFGAGLTVELDHGSGVVSRYEHCRSAAVRPGEEVSAGAVIATVGSSGLATGPHVHFEVLVNGHAVDPLRYLIVSRLPVHEATTAAAAPAAPTGAAPQQ